MRLLRIAFIKISLYFLIVTFGVALVFGLAVLALNAAIAPMSAVFDALATLVVAALVIACFRLVQGRLFYVGMIGVFVISRLLLVLLVPVVPASDSYAFRLLGFTMTQESSACAPFSMGYPLFLNLYYRLIGDSILLIQTAHIGLGLISLGLMYAIGRRLGGERMSRLAVLLFTFRLSQWILTSVIVSEHLALVFFLASVWCVVSYQKSVRD